MASRDPRVGEIMLEEIGRIHTQKLKADLTPFRSLSSNIQDDRPLCTSSLENV